MKMQKPKINKALVPMKAHYFLFNAGTAPVVPFLSVYARQLGFSSIIVGTIYTILPICGMLAKPIFGAISDRFHWQKRIFLVSQLVTAVMFLAVFYSPKVPFDQHVEFNCDSIGSNFKSLPGSNYDESLFKHVVNEGNVLEKCQLNCQMTESNWAAICSNPYMSSTNYCRNSYQEKLNFNAKIPASELTSFNDTVTFKISNISLQNDEYFGLSCRQEVKTNCDLNCDSDFINKLTSVAVFADSDVYGLYQYWLFLIFMILSWVGQAIVVSVGDAICFEMLGDKPNRYGYQRMFGALGWGIVAGLTGIMIDSLSKDKADKDYISAFYLAVAFLVLDFIVSSQLKYTQKKISANILKDVGKLLVNIRIIVYMLCCICMGMCTGIIWNFLMWLVEDLAKAQGGDTSAWMKTLQGLMMLIQCLGGELPFFFLSGKILKKIGHVNAMSLVLFVVGVRFILYSVIANPWYFLPIELSNGLTFGLFYACMASYASIVAPPGTEATMQGMMGAVFEGVGVSLGSFLAGLLYSKYAGPETFRIFGIGALTACLVHIIVQYLLRFKGQSTKYSPASKLEKIKDEENKGLTLVNSFPILS